MNKIEIVIIFILIVFVLFYVQKKYLEVEYVTSSVDNQKYLVQNRKNKKKAANMLARLDDKITRLIDHVYKKDSVLTQLLKDNYVSENISEGTDDTKYTSYSVNKGEQLVFCLRSRDNADKFVEENVLMYVATHELAHLMTSDIGHTPLFWENFKYLLNEAVNINVYTKTNYAESPIDYCGINIKSSII